MSEAITKACPVCTNLYVEHCTLCSGTGHVPDIEANMRAQLDAQRILIERFESALRGKESENAELRGELHALRGIDYATATGPGAYRCNECGASGVKLWRVAHNGEVLWCCDCAGLRESVSVNKTTDDGMTWSAVHHAMTCFIGNLLPAIRTPDGVDTWGHTSSPEDACAWWRRLPLRRGAVVTLRAEVASLQDLLRRAVDIHQGYESEVTELRAEVERLKGREAFARTYVERNDVDSDGDETCPECGNYVRFTSGSEHECPSTCPRAAWLAGCKS